VIHELGFPDGLHAVRELSQRRERGDYQRY